MSALLLKAEVLLVVRELLKIPFAPQKPLYARTSR
jgi:hypothetical protein